MTNISYADIINSKDLIPLLQNQKTKYVTINNLIEKIINSVPRENPQDPCYDEKQDKEIHRLWESLKCIIKKVNDTILLAEKTWKFANTSGYKTQELELQVKELKTQLEDIPEIKSDLELVKETLANVKEIKITTAETNTKVIYTFTRGTAIVGTIEVPKTTLYRGGNNIKIQDNVISVTGLSRVATSGNFNDLSSKPTIPTMVSQLENDSNFVDEISMQQYVNQKAAAATTKVQENRGNTHILVNQTTGSDGSKTYTIVEQDIASARTLSQAIRENTSNANVLSGQIQTERTRAINAETNLQTNINTEKTQREAADLQLKLTITENTTDSSVLKSYTVKQGTDTVGTIQIPKDLVVKSGSVVTNSQGIKVIRLVLNVAAGTPESDAIIDIPVGDLVDVYTGKTETNGITVSVVNKEIRASLVGKVISKSNLTDAFLQELEDTEETIATALNDLNSRIIETNTNFNNSIVNTLGNNIDKIISQKGLTDIIQAPTLTTVPTASTLTYTLDGNTHSFVLGSKCRVRNTSSKYGYDYYILVKIENNQATWVRFQQLDKLGTINVNVSANQSENIIGKKIYLKSNTDGLIEEKTWNGQTVTFDVTNLVTCYVEMESITGYQTPKSNLFTVTGDTVHNVNLEYKAQSLTITATSGTGSDASINGTSVLVKSNGTTLYTFPITETDRVFTCLVPYGERIDVSIKDANNFTSSQVYTDINPNTIAKAITVTYYGITAQPVDVHILDTDGNLIEVADWNGGTDIETNNAVGVVIYTNMGALVVHPKQSSSILQWGPQGFDIQTNTTDGLTNTAAILEEGEANQHTYPAAQYCVLQPFKDGRQGYLPSMNELLAIAVYKNQLNTALGAIGGTQFKDTTYWSSSQASTMHAWYCHLQDSSARSYGKYISTQVRSVAHLNL